MKKHKQYTSEGYMLANGKTGETFYSDKSDRSLTAFANYYNRHITTERFIAVTSQSNTPVACKITKVTLGLFKEAIHDF